MLTMRFLDVRDLRPLPISSMDSDGAAPIAAPEFVDNRGDVRWSVQVRHGGKEYRTRYVHLPRDRPDKGVRRNGAGTSSRLTCSNSSRQAQQRNAGSAVPSSRDVGTPLWEEIDILDQEGLDTVEIRLLTEITRRGRLRRRLVQHSVGTIEIGTFRAQPEQRLSIRMPLRPVASSMASTYEENVGTLHINVTYSDDYYSMEEGYMVGMFCGLAPLCLGSPSLKGRSGGEGGRFRGYLLPMSESFSCLFGSNNDALVFDSPSSARYSEGADADAAGGNMARTGAAAAAAAGSTSARGVSISVAPLSDYHATLMEASGVSSPTARTNEARVKSPPQHHHNHNHHRQEVQSVLIAPHSSTSQPQPNADSVEGETPPNVLGSSATRRIALEA